MERGSSPCSNSNLHSQELSLSDHASLLCLFYNLKWTLSEIACARTMKLQCGKKLFSIFCFTCIDCFSDQKLKIKLSVPNFARRAFYHKFSTNNVFSKLNFKSSVMFYKIIIVTRVTKVAQLKVAGMTEFLPKGRSATCLILFFVFF